jgi:hypothetical protein
MNSKPLKLITFSLATCVLLAPAQGAFGREVESQPLVHDISSKLVNSKATQNPGTVQEDQATESKQSLPIAATSQTAQSSLPQSEQQTTEVSNTVGGLLVIFVFISYIFAGIQYRKYRAHRAAVLLQQIETLERIWRMKPQKR